jgi:hypothetical protein
VLPWFGCEGTWSPCLDRSTDLLQWSHGLRGVTHLLYWTHEPVAPSWKGYDTPPTVRFVSEGSPKNGDSLGQAVLADKGVRPYSSNEDILFDDLIGMLKKVDE